MLAEIFCLRPGFWSLLHRLYCARSLSTSISGGNECSRIGGVRNYRNSCANQNRVHFVIFPRLYVRRGLEATTVWCETNHSCNTRKKGDYQSHMFRMRTVLNTGPKIWNKLPKYVKCSKSISQFKRNFVSDFTTHDRLVNQVFEYTYIFKYFKALL